MSVDEHHLHDAQADTGEGRSHHQGTVIQHGQGESRAVQPGVGDGYQLGSDHHRQGEPEPREHGPHRQDGEQVEAEQHDGDEACVTHGAGVPEPWWEKPARRHPRRRYVNGPFGSERHSDTWDDTWYDADSPAGLRRPPTGSSNRWRGTVTSPAVKSALAKARQRCRATPAPNSSRAYSRPRSAIRCRITGASDRRTAAAASAGGSSGSTHSAAPPVRRSSRAHAPSALTAASTGRPAAR